MKNFHDSEGEKDAYEVLDMGVVDPTLISLFSDEVPQYSALTTAQQPSSSTTPAAVGNGVGLHDRPATFASVQSAHTTRTVYPTAGTLATAAAAKEPMTQKVAGERRKHISYSTYIQGKSTEVAKRRRLNERVEKMKSSRGIVFNVPQCNEITTNQLAIFLRRLRKSADIRSMMSSQLISTIFQDEALPKADFDPDRRQAANTNTATVALVTSVASRSDTAAAGTTEVIGRQHINLQQQQQHQTAVQSHHYHRQSSSKHPAVISVSDILGEKDDSLPSTSHHHFRQRFQQTTYSGGVDDEGETTESSSDSDDWSSDVDDEVSDEKTDNTSKSADRRERRWQRITMDDYYFYKKRMEIISADLRAATYYRHCVELQVKANKALMPVEFEFESASSTGDEVIDSLTCARCRGLTNCPSRRIIRHTQLEKRNLPATVIRPNLRCGVAEYASVDDGIHPLLSLESAIPMERKLQKYLHVSNMLAPEVERRRQKIAEMVFRKQSKSSVKSSALFYSTDELQHPPEEESSKSPTSISLTLKKRLLLKESGGESSLIDSGVIGSTTVATPTTSRSRVRPRPQRVSVNENIDQTMGDEPPTRDEDESSIATTFDEEDEEDVVEEATYRPRVLSRRRVNHGGHLAKRGVLNDDDDDLVGAQSGTSTRKKSRPLPRRPLSARQLKPNRRYIAEATWLGRAMKSGGKSKSHAATSLKNVESKLKNGNDGKSRLAKILAAESRRSSMHNIGRDESVFDFDSTFTDIGLTSIQNVETKEILIPQFVRKEVLDRDCEKPCEHCTAFTDADPFEKIRQMHEVLEAQERVRFRSLTGSTRPRPSQSTHNQQQKVAAGRSEE